MDATHFRLRAAHAREMARSGDDLRLSRMLLDVARELDAEAEAMEAEAPTGRIPSATPPAFQKTRLHATDGGADLVPVEIIDLAIRGVKIRADGQSGQDAALKPDVREYALHLEDMIAGH